MVSKEEFVSDWRGKKEELWQTNIYTHTVPTEWFIVQICVVIVVIAKEEDICVLHIMQTSENGQKKAAFQQQPILFILGWLFFGCARTFCTDSL